MRTYPATAEQIQILTTELPPKVALIALICAETGLRVSDAIALQRNKFTRTVAIKEQKTGKKRKIKLSMDLYRLLKHWIAVWPDDGTGRVVAVDRSTVYRHIKQVAQKYGWVHLSAHSLRKAYAMNYCKYNGIAATQIALGHKNVETTILYIMSPDQIEMLRGEVSKGGPLRARLERHAGA